MLKQWLIMFLAEEPLWKFQMSTQTTAILDLGNTLMTHGFEANMTFLNKCVSLRMPSMKLGVTTHSSELYESPTIFINNLDFGRQGSSIESRLILSMLFKKFSIVDKSDMFARQFIVMMILLFDIQMKSAIISDLEFFRHLLILVI